MLETLSRLSVGREKGPNRSTSEKAQTQRGQRLAAAGPLRSFGRTPVLTVRVLQLSHSGHEGLLGHVAARALLHEGLLVRAVQLLGELHRLQGCQAAGHTVDDGDTLCLGGVQACGGKTERLVMTSAMRRGAWMAMAIG